MQGTEHREHSTEEELEVQGTHWTRIIQILDRFFIIRKHPVYSSTPISNILHFQELGSSNLT